jgi:transposase
MRLRWLENTKAAWGCNAGNLALTVPLLERAGVAGIIDRHLQPDIRCKASPGKVLALLIAARLHKPTPISRIGEWAEDTGADIMFDVDADTLNDDRIGRALDALFEHRHSILGSIAVHVAQEFGIPLSELHFDPTHITFYGEYKNSEARPDVVVDGALADGGGAGMTDRPAAAHITKGRRIDGVRKISKIIHVGLCFAADEHGGVPMFAHVQSGNENGMTGIADHHALLRKQIPINGTVMISDAGTFSVQHIKRLLADGMDIICAIPKTQARALYEKHVSSLNWSEASYRSIEQQRRRDSRSSLPLEHHELAEIQHELYDRETKSRIPCRLIFVFSTAGKKAAEEARQKNVRRVRKNLEALRQSVAKGCRNTDEQSIRRRAATALGSGQASKYFAWQIVPLSKDEFAALPTPKPGKRRPTHRFEYAYDAAVADRDAISDGISAILTTLSRESSSADETFTKYKRQAYSELANHQLKTPIAISPIFLHKPERVEALVFILTIALMIYYLVQHEYRRNLPPTASSKQRRTTTETLFRAFEVYLLIVSQSRLGQIITPSRLRSTQRQILQDLNLPPPAAVLSRYLPRQTTT